MLVVDDDPAFQELLRQFFTLRGWEVLVASGADQGITLFRRHHPAAAILDVNLGGGGRDGLSLCDQIRDDISSENTAIVVLSADRRTAADQLKGRAVGADTYILKPVQMVVLSDRLDEVLRKKKIA